MNWNQANSSIHHRSETSSSNFHNANGGILGDSKIILRYLAKDAGDLEMDLRLYTGTGITIPSKNQLTSDPFFLNGDNVVKEHRHFSLSNGTYNYNIESSSYILNVVQIQHFLVGLYYMRNHLLKVNMDIYLQQI